MNVFFFLAILVLLLVGVLLFFPKSRAFVKKHGKAFIGLLLGLVGIGVADQAFELLKEAIFGKVTKPQAFTPIDATHVITQVDGVWKSVPLPAGTTSDKVRAVQVDASGQPTVELKNAPVDQA